MPIYVFCYAWIRVKLRYGNLSSPVLVHARIKVERELNSLLLQFEILEKLVTLIPDLVSSDWRPRDL